jgi:hypothetical protein
MNDAENEIYNRAFKDFLSRRGIEIDLGDEPCRACSGYGYRAYGSTATWRGGIGGQMITGDICDLCWGSGNAKKPWLNLRRVSKDVIKLALDYHEAQQ